MWRFPPPSSELTDLSVIVGSAARLARLDKLYEDYLSQEWFQPWEAFSWVVGDL